MLSYNRAEKIPSSCSPRGVHVASAATSSVRPHLRNRVGAIFSLLAARGARCVWNNFICAPLRIKKLLSQSYCWDKSKLSCGATRLDVIFLHPLTAYYHMPDLITESPLRLAYSYPSAHPPKPIPPVSSYRFPPSAALCHEKSLKYLLFFIGL